METIFDLIMNRFYEQNILEQQFPSIVQQLQEREETVSEDFDDRTFLNAKQPIFQQETSSNGLLSKEKQEEIPNGLLSKEEQTTKETSSNGLLSKEKQEEIPSGLLSKEEQTTKETSSNGLLSKEKQEEIPSGLLSKEEQNTKETSSNGLLSKEKQEKIPSGLLSKEEQTTKETSSNGLLSKEKQEKIPSGLLSKEEQTTKKMSSGLLSKIQEADAEVVYEAIQPKKESSKTIQQKKYHQSKNQSKNAPFIEQNQKEQKQYPLLSKDGSVHSIENEITMGAEKEKEISILQKENQIDVEEQNKKTSFVLEKNRNQKNVSEMIEKESSSSIIPKISKKGKKIKSNVLEELVYGDKNLSSAIIKTQKQNEAPLSKEDTKIKSILQNEPIETNVLNELDSSNLMLSKNNSIIQKNEISELLTTEKQLNQNLFSLDMEEEKQNQKKAVSKKNFTNKQKEQIINELTNSNSTFDQYTNVFENATQNHTEYNPLLSENLGSDVILNKIYEVLANQSTQRTNHTENVSVHVSQLDAGSGMDSMMSEISRQLWQTRQGSTKNSW